MSDVAAAFPQRLHFGRVMVLAFVLTIAGIFIVLVQSTASSEAVGSAGFWMVIATPVIGIFSLIWFSVVWVLFRWQRQWHGRTWLALLPTLLLLSDVAIRSVSQPSREQRIRQSFQNAFGIPLPPQAFEIDISPPAFGSGVVTFSFRCPPEATQTLLKSMKFEKNLNEGAVPMESYWYSRHDQNGIQWSLLSNLDMDNVEVTRVVPRVRQ